MMTESQFPCFLVDKSPAGRVQTHVQRCSQKDLPAGDVLIRVLYSSLNYKDAMAAEGHPGIVKSFPHVPGIDAAGTVIQSDDKRFQPGDPIIATGHEFGVERWGGWSAYLRTPGDWLVPLPDGLSLEESMIFGTAGFTAAQCVQALQRQGLSPDSGEVVVSGATGGVGSIAVLLLSHLGFSVTAVTGKDDQHDWLRSLGARHVVGREALADNASRPLLSARYVGGVDTVGGPVLTAMCKQISHRGAIACCGMAGGAELNLTVYPFILRGLALLGVDSAWCPDDDRKQIWQRLASDWKPPHLQQLKRTASLSQLPERIHAILDGENVGRVVVRLTDE